MMAALYLQVSIVSQALIFVTRSRTGRLSSALVSYYYDNSTLGPVSGRTLGDSPMAGVYGCFSVPARRNELVWEIHRRSSFVGGGVSPVTRVWICVCATPKVEASLT